MDAWGRNDAAAHAQRFFCSFAAISFCTGDMRSADDIEPPRGTKRTFLRKRIRLGYDRAPTVFLHLLQHRLELEVETNFAFLQVKNGPAKVTF